MARRSTSRLALESAAVLCAVLAAAGWVFARAVYRPPPERAGLSRTASAVVDEAIVEAGSGSGQRRTPEGGWGAPGGRRHPPAHGPPRTRKGAPPHPPHRAPAPPTPHAAAATDGLCAAVEGLAPPGAEVTVDAATAAVAADGRFQVRVPRAGERREVLVALRDAAGHEERRKLRCVDPPARIDDFAIHWRTRTP